MSHSNVTTGMSGADVNSEGKPYHEHGDKKDTKEEHDTSKCEHSNVKDHTPHHGHDNQFHKDMKGSVGSGSSHKGDHKCDEK